MLDHDLTRLWTELSAKVWVQKIEDGLTKPARNQCTIVTLHPDTDPDSLSTLPITFAREPIEYVILDNSVKAGPA